VPRPAVRLPAGLPPLAMTQLRVEQLPDGEQ